MNTKEANKIMAEYVRKHPDVTIVKEVLPACSCGWNGKVQLGAHGQPFKKWLDYAEKLIEKQGR